MVSAVQQYILYIHISRCRLYRAGTQLMFKLNFKLLINYKQTAATAAAAALTTSLFFTEYLLGTIQTHTRNILHEYIRVYTHTPTQAAPERAFQSIINVITVYSSLLSYSYNYITL